jgi:hypothetical protein
MKIHKILRIFWFISLGNENIFKENVFYIIFDLYEKSNSKPIKENIKLNSNDNCSLIKILKSHHKNKNNQALENYNNVNLVNKMKNFKNNIFNYKDEINILNLNPFPISSSSSTSGFNNQEITYYYLVYKS